MPARLRHRLVCPRHLNRRGVAALEFAIVSVPFFLFLLFVVEISYDLFTQEALDEGLHAAMRSIQTGNAQNVTSASAFITQYMCPSMRGLLECGARLFINVQKLSFSGSQDYYNATTGIIPVVGNTLNLGAYGNAGFCNSGPSEFLLISAIYVGPSLIGGLLPNLLSVSYGGAPVHATLSSTGAVTEAYAAVGAPNGTTPAPAC